jgi:hypothetical protein
MKDQRIFQTTRNRVPGRRGSGIARSRAPRGCDPRYGIIFQYRSMAAALRVLNRDLDTRKLTDHIFSWLRAAGV